ncbi:helix-turn-helix domain-containing protein [Streptomyces sp. NPDC001621]|uniref:helix-turn-helix domain-containing protein n=1 Tax=Streptomyces sp. NPDC001621 TaxID=3364594 RepID=UPI00369D326B
MKTAPAGPHHAALAHRLHEFRQRAGLTFAELAERIAALGDPALAVSAATLKRAAGCRTLPKQTTVVAYARGCGATPAEERRALRLWARARAKDRGILRQLHPPAVHNIRTRREFTAALAAAYESAGAPPLRTVQQRAGTVPQPVGVACESEVFLLPLGTCWRIANRKTKLPAWKHCEAFLRGCGITGERVLQQWNQAWQHASTAFVTAPRQVPQPIKPEGIRMQRRQIMQAMEVKVAVDGLAPDHSFTPHRPRKFGDEYHQSIAALAELYRGWKDSARLNGLASDNGIVLVSCDGSVCVVQAKYDTARSSRSKVRAQRRAR